MKSIIRDMFCGLREVRENQALGRWGQGRAEGRREKCGIQYDIQCVKKLLEKVFSEILVKKKRRRKIHGNPRKIHGVFHGLFHTICFLLHSASFWKNSTEYWRWFTFAWQCFTVCLPYWGALQGAIGALTAFFWYHAFFPGLSNATYFCYLLLLPATSSYLGRLGFGMTGVVVVIVGAVGFACRLKLRLTAPVEEKKAYFFRAVSLRASPRQQSSSASSTTKNEESPMRVSEERKKKICFPVSNDSTWCQ